MADESRSIAHFRAQRKDDGNWVEGSLIYDEECDAFFIVEQVYDLKELTLPRQFGVYAYCEVKAETIKYLGGCDDNGD